MESPANPGRFNLILRSNRDNVVLKIDEVRVSDIQRYEFPSPVAPTNWGVIKALFR